MLLLVLVLSTTFVQESDEDTRARIRAKVDRFAGEDIEDRDRAAAELLKIHVRYAPYIADLGSRLGPGASALLERLAVPAPWPEFLKGTIHESRDLLARITAGEGGRTSAAAGQALKDLALRPSQDIQRILGALWSSSNPRFRELAVDGWVRWPPVDLSQVRPLLDEPPLADRAATILILAGDEDAVPAALNSYATQRREGGRAAMRVLARFGVGDADMERILEVWKEGGTPLSEDFWIFGRRGTEKGAKILADWIKASGPGADQAVPVLAWVGSEAQMHRVRQWATDHAKEKTLPWIHNPSEAVRRFESLGAEPTPQDFINKLTLAWQAGPALRDPILAALARPGLKLNYRRVLLGLLGAAGRSEDASLLVDGLKDPRLADAAALGLDRIGDPGHARPLFEAFMRIGDSRHLSPAVLGLPVGDLEDLLIEVISDADSYERQSAVAVILAGRKLTPALRDVMMKAYARGPHVKRAVEFVLLDSSRRTDADLIRHLLNARDPGLRGIGSHLALRNGEASGGILAAETLKAAAMGTRYDLGRPWLDGGMEGGDAWREAVEKVWKKDRNPTVTWPLAVWLAEQGVPEALEEIRARLSQPPSMTTGYDARAMALGGTPEDVAKAVEMFLDPRLQLERSSEVPARLDARVGERLDPALRTRILNLARAEGPPDVSGRSNRRALRLAAQMQIREGLPLYRYVAFLAFEPVYSPPEDQVECIRVLGALKDAASAPTLRLQVRSIHPAIRVAAMDALAILGDRDAAARIARYVDDFTELPSPVSYEWGPYTQRPIRRVWHHAMEALEKLTGEKAPAGSVTQRREFWRAWAVKNP